MSEKERYKLTPLPEWLFSTAEHEASIADVRGNFWAIEGQLRAHHRDMKKPNGLPLFTSRQYAALDMRIWTAEFGEIVLEMHFDGDRKWRAYFIKHRGEYVYCSAGSSICIPGPWSLKLAAIRRELDDRFGPIESRK